MRLRLNRIRSFEAGSDLRRHAVGWDQPYFPAPIPLRKVRIELRKAGRLQKSLLCTMAPVDRS